MSFLGQSIRNTFPLWSKIRKDDSSIGAIIFDELGKALEETRVSVFRRGIQSKVLAGSAIMEPEKLHVFNLLDSPTFAEYIDENRLYTSLSASAKIGQTDIALTNIYSYSDLCQAFATRSSLMEELNHYDYQVAMLTTAREDSTVYEFYKKPNHIYINVYGSTHYNVSMYDENFKDTYYVILRGTDIFNKKIEEKIHVNNDGLFKSKNIYRTLQPLEIDIENNISGGASIEAYGFDGTLEVLRYPLQVAKKLFPLKVLVKKNDELNFNSSLEENFGFFELTARTLEDGSTTATKLSYIFHAYENAFEYLNTQNEMSKDFFEQSILEQDVLNADLTQKIIQDFTFDDVRNSLVTLDSEGTLDWYQLNRTTFERPEYERTKTINITLEADKQQVLLEESLSLHVSMERAKGNIEYVIIARQKPSMRKQTYDSNNALITTFNFEYLQEDYSWSDQKYFFKGTDDDDKFLRFEGISLENKFDEYGQHDFYVFSFANEFNKNRALNTFADGTLSEAEFKKQLLNHLEDEYQEIVLIDTYSVCCEGMLPQHTIQTDVIAQITAKGEDATTYSLGVFFEGLKNTLKIVASDETNTFLFSLKEHKDYILFDYLSGTGAVVEEYDSIAMNINDTLTEEVLAQ